MFSRLLRFFMLHAEMPCGMNLVLLFPGLHSLRRFLLRRKDLPVPRASKANKDKYLQSLFLLFNAFNLRDRATKALCAALPGTIVLLSMRF